MLSRALSLATVMLVLGCFAAKPARSQAQNLEAGKSPSQIFAGACTACHKSPRGLLKTVPAGSLQGFLRQHYTTSPEMASLLSGFLVSNGAADTRYVGAQPKEGREPKSDARSDGSPEQLDRSGRRLRPASPPEAGRPEAGPPEAAARPDADGLSEAPARRRGRNAKHLARPEEAPDAEKPAVEGQTPAQAATERGPDGRKLSAKQRLGKGKRGSEPPKAEAAKTDAVKTDAAKPDAAKTDAAKEEPAKVEEITGDKPKSEPNSESVKVEGGKPEGAKPSDDDKKPSEDKPGSAKIEAPKEPGSGETPTLRADPAPPAAPAPTVSPPVSAAVSGGTAEPAAAGPSAPAAQ